VDGNAECENNCPRLTFVTPSPGLRVPCFIPHPFAFILPNTPCQMLGFGVKSPSVFETIATGAFSRELSQD